jgi:hypothetical protein
MSVVPLMSNVWAVGACCSKFLLPKPQSAVHADAPNSDNMVKAFLNKPRSLLIAT